MTNPYVRGMAAGFLATVVLSALMVMKAMMGVMPGLNAIRMLTQMAHGMLGTPASPAVGWLLHFLIGTVSWGTTYAWLRPRLPGGPAARGMLFATGAWLMMMLVVMPMAGAGPFGLRLGVMAPVATLVLHLVYGAVLGVADARLACAGHPAGAQAQG